ncbi:MAG TPA: hypothetical protein VMQ17_09430 [Candidatus Sulfotelmatobacter sp.]|nr:hypothetical protein [Candidatus Sulfotelmatobacter sp.]
MAQSKAGIGNSSGDRLILVELRESGGEEGFLGIGETGNRFASAGRPAAHAGIGGNGLRFGRSCCEHHK